MLLDFNNDCLMEIFDYLDLQSQINLAEVCQELRDFTISRFNRSQREYQSYEDQPSKIPKYLEYLEQNSKGEIVAKADFLYKIQDAIGFLEFEDITKLKIYTKGFPLEANNDFLRLIMQMFPYLEKLSIVGDFKIKLIWQLHNLKELEIDSEDLDFHGIKTFQFMNLKKLTLKQDVDCWLALKELAKLSDLEELHIRMTDYAEFATNMGFKLLKGLKKLMLTTNDEEGAEECFYLFLRDCDHYRKIDSISFINVSLTEEQTLGIDLMDEMTRLRCVSFLKDNGTILNAFCKLNETSWQTLEEISFMNAISDEKSLQEQQEQILKLIKKCKNLKVLDIRGTQFGDDFLKRIAIIYHAQSRKNELQIRCYNTKITKNSERKFVSKQLILCFDDSNYDSPMNNVVEINFKHEHSIDDVLHYLHDMLSILSKFTEDCFLWNIIREKEERLRLLREERILLQADSDIAPERLQMSLTVLDQMQNDLQKQIEVIEEVVILHTYLA